MVNNTTKYSVTPGEIPLTTLEGDLSLQETLNRKEVIFSTVDEMKGSSFLEVGSHCKTLGYREPGDLGAMSYEIVPSGTGVDDGGTFINLPASGHQAKGIFRENRKIPQQFGADGTKENDPVAISAWLASGKKLALTRKHYVNFTVETNGHDIDGSVAETFSSGGAGFIFFGGFTDNFAYINSGEKSLLRSISFSPDSWDSSTGYEGNGGTIRRAVSAYDCSFVGFKGKGLYLYEDVTNAYFPYYSTFVNCQFDYSGQANIHLAQGANAVQFYGGTCRWGGAPGYLTAPTNNSTGWDGLLISHVVDGSIPLPDNDFTTQGIIIEGIDCSYNARYGANISYCNQSKIHIGYCEDNLQDTDIRVDDVVACDINIIQSQQGADVVTPSKGFAVSRSAENYPNKILVNGESWGSGTKDAYGNPLDLNGALASKIISKGSSGQVYFRVLSDGSVESFSNGPEVLFRMPAGSGLPTADERYAGVLFRDTSVGPNKVYACVEASPGVWQWSALN